VPGFEGATVNAIALTDGEAGNAALMTGTLGGSGITANAPWEGKWTAVGRVHAEKLEVTVQSTTALVVRIRRMKEQARK
jgi:hypothetical protein